MARRAVERAVDDPAVIEATTRGATLIPNEFELDAADEHTMAGRVCVNPINAVARVQAFMAVTGS